MPRQPNPAFTAPPQPKLSGQRILLVHAGGESRRLPAYAPEGKLFAPLGLAYVIAIMNLMLAEEDALLNGDSTVTAAPWGDGTTALAFDGLTKLIATANGTPSTHIQTAVGQLTLAHIDAQLTRLYYQGARSPWILIAGQEAKSLTNQA